MSGNRAGHLAPDSPGRLEESGAKSGKGNLQSRRQVLDKVVLQVMRGGEEHDDDGGFWRGSCKKKRDRRLQRGLNWRDEGVLPDGRDQI